MAKIWKYNEKLNTWDFYSENHVAFRFSSVISDAVLGADKRNDLMQEHDPLTEAVLDKTRLLLRLVMRDGIASMYRRSHSTTMSEQEEQAAIEFGNSAGLFELSASGVFEVIMED